MQYSLFSLSISYLRKFPHNLETFLLPISLLLGSLIHWVSQRVLCSHLKELSMVLIKNGRWALTGIKITCRNYVEWDADAKDLCDCQSIAVGSQAYCQSLWKHHLILKGKSSMNTLCVCKIPVAPVTLASHQVIWILLSHQNYTNKNKLRYFLLLEHTWGPDCHHIRQSCCSSTFVFW